MEVRKMPARVYISYKQSDASDLAEWLRDQLLRRGVAVWLDKFDLEVGRDFRDEIERAIRESDVVLALISRGPTGGGVIDDHVIALSAGKFCIPILVQRDAPIPSYFRRFQYLDLSDADRREEHFNLLLDQILRRSRTTKQESSFEYENPSSIPSASQSEPEPTPVPAALSLAYRAVLARLVTPDLLRNLESFPWEAVSEKLNLSELENTLPVKPPQPLWEAWIRATKPREVAALEKALGAAIQNKRISG